MIERKKSSWSLSKNDWANTQLARYYSNTAGQTRGQATGERLRQGRQKLLLSNVVWILSCPQVETLSVPNCLLKIEIHVSQLLLSSGPASSWLYTFNCEQGSKALPINVPGEAGGQGQWFHEDLPSPTVCFQEEHAESVPAKASSEIVNGLFFILLLVVWNIDP